MTVLALVFSVVVIYPYQKHFIGLSDNVTYVVEDKAVTQVDKYKYTLNYNPKMRIPIGVETID